jgi:hypothetical protein
MSDTGVAATDLGMGGDDRPSAYPQGLAGFANRSSGNYGRQTSPRSPLAGAFHYREFI